LVFPTDPIPPGRAVGDAALRDVEIRGYSVPGGKCFLDEIKGVHVKEVREIIESD